MHLHGLCAAVGAVHHLLHVAHQLADTLHLHRQVAVHVGVQPRQGRQLVCCCRRLRVVLLWLAVVLLAACLRLALLLLLRAVGGRGRLALWRQWRALCACRRELLLVQRFHLVQQALPLRLLLQLGWGHSGGIGGKRGWAVRLRAAPTCWSSTHPRQPLTHTRTLRKLASRARSPALRASRSTV